MRWIGTEDCVSAAKNLCIHTYPCSTYLYKKRSSTIKFYPFSACYWLPIWKIMWRWICVIIIDHNYWYSFVGWIFEGLNPGKILNLLAEINALMWSNLGFWLIRFGLSPDLGFWYLSWDGFSGGFYRLQLITIV